MKQSAAKVNFITAILFMPPAIVIASIQWWVDQNSWRYYWQIGLIAALLLLNGFAAIISHWVAQHIVAKIEYVKHEQQIGDDAASNIFSPRT